MVDEGRAQSIVIRLTCVLFVCSEHIVCCSGESGAGKTETAKQVLHFLGSTCGQIYFCRRFLFVMTLALTGEPSSDPNAVTFQDMIVGASPVLEAYAFMHLASQHLVFQVWECQNAEK